MYRRIEEQDGGGIDSELSHGLGEECRQADIQVEAEIDRAVDFHQGAQMLQMALHPFLGGFQVADIREDQDNLAHLPRIIQLGIGIHQHPVVFPSGIAGDPHDAMLHRALGGQHLLDGKLLRRQPGSVLAHKVPERVGGKSAQQLLRG